MIDFVFYNISIEIFLRKKNDRTEENFLKQLSQCYIKGKNKKGVCLPKSFFPFPSLSIFLSCGVVDPCIDIYLKPPGTKRLIIIQIISECNAGAFWIYLCHQCLQKRVFFF